MMKRLLIYIIGMLLAFPCVVKAQTAKQVLDKTSAALKKAGGIEARFTATSFAGTEEKGSTTGTIQVQGSKFKLVSAGLSTWFNGTTQWTLLAGSDEVNVTNPSAAELQQINPYNFVTLYKQGYDLSMKETKYSGKSCHEVTLHAQSAHKGIQTMIVIVDKKSFLPLNIRLKDRKGAWTRIAVNSVQTGKSWPTPHFEFSAAEHPGIEINDLR